MPNRQNLEQQANELFNQIAAIQAANPGGELVPGPGYDGPYPGTYVPPSSPIAQPQQWEHAGPADIPRWDLGMGDTGSGSNIPPNENVSPDLVIPPNYPAPGGPADYPSPGQPNNFSSGVPFLDAIGHGLSAYTPGGRALNTFWHFLTGTLGEHGDAPAHTPLLYGLARDAVRGLSGGDNNETWQQNAAGTGEGPADVSDAPQVAQDTTNQAVPRGDQGINLRDIGQPAGRLPQSPLSGGTWGGTYELGSLLNQLVGNQPSNMNWPGSQPTSQRSASAGTSYGFGAGAASGTLSSLLRAMQI